MMHSPPSAPPRGRPSHLSAEDLIRRWQRDRDVRARDAVYEQFSSLAHRLAGRYRNPYEPQEDLVQVARLGLIGAIERFDPARGVPFTAFAIPTILGELKRHFRNTGWAVHVPRNAQEMALKVDAAARQMAADTGRTPSVSAIAAYLEVEVADVVAALDAGAAHYSVSLDAQTRDSPADEPTSLGESVGTDDDAYELVETKLSLAAAVARLPNLERRALELRAQHNLKQSEIARHLHCSQMQVSRLLRRASARVREQTDPALAHR